MRSAEELEKRVPELEGIQRLVGPLGEVVGNELVEVLPPNQPVEVVDKVKALLIRNSAEGIVGVNALVADAELCELVVFAVRVDGLLYIRNC